MAAEATGDPFAGARKNYKVLFEQCHELMGELFDMCRARTGMYEPTDRFCKFCERNYLHSGNDKCGCVCHKIREFLMEHPTPNMVATAAKEKEISDAEQKRNAEIKAEMDRAREEGEAFERKLRGQEAAADEKVSQP